MSKVIESMTKIEVGPQMRLKSPTYVIRVWRDEKELKEVYDNEDLVKEANRLYKLDKWAIHNIVDGLAKLKRVSAVEAIKGDGAGILVYPKWP